MSVEVPMLAEFVPSYISRQEGIKRIDNAYSPIQKELEAITNAPRDAAVKTGEAIVFASILTLASSNPAQATDLFKPENFSPDKIRAGQIVLSGLAGAGGGVAWELIEQRGIKKNWIEIVGSAFLGATTTAGADFIWQSGKNIYENKDLLEAAKFLAIPATLGSAYLFSKTKDIFNRTKEGALSLKSGVVANIEYKNYKSALKKMIKLSNKPSASSQELLSQMLNKYQTSLEQIKSDWHELKNTGRISRFNG